MKSIQYAIHSEGYVISRVGSEVAWPVLDFAGMTPENSYEMNYYLEKVSVHEIVSEWNLLNWTRKVPLKVKNVHREYWGFPRLIA